MVNNLLAKAKALVEHEATPDDDRPVMYDHIIGMHIERAFFHAEAMNMEHALLESCCAEQMAQDAARNVPASLYARIVSKQQMAKTMRAKALHHLGRDIESMEALQSMNMQVVEKGDRDQLQLMGNIVRVAVHARAHQEKEALELLEACATLISEDENETVLDEWSDGFVRVVIIGLGGYRDFSIGAMCSFLSCHPKASSSFIRALKKLQESFGDTLQLVALQGNDLGPTKFAVLFQTLSDMKVKGLLLKNVSGSSHCS